MLPSGGKFIPTIPSQTPFKTFLSFFQFSKTLSHTQQLHAQIIINGLHRSVLFGSKLSNAYIDMGSLQLASKSFNQIPRKNPYSWNTIISGYSKQKHSYEVLKLFRHMRNESHGVDSFNLVFAIKACVGLSLLLHGKSVHCLVFKHGFERDPYIVPVLINMYTELGCLDNAEKVFESVPERNVVIWGAMMKGHLKFSNEFKVFELFSEMRSSGFELDPFTSESLIRACGNVYAGKEGRACHGFCVKRNFIDYSMCLKASLVDMYMKCGLADLAMKLFIEIPEKDVVLWTVMVTGFVKNGRAWEAVGCFKQMFEDSATPNSVTLSGILLACTHMGSLQHGKSVHGYMLRNGVELDMVNCTSFIDMYAKCGCIAAANKFFNQMPKKNVFTWSAMINGFGMHGLYSEAIVVFNQMRSEDQVPNAVTFVSVLSACSHSGRVEEGWNYFKSMSRDYGIAPTEEHFACIINLLGRAGKMDEALSIISNMPMDPGASSWGALLSACRIHKRIELAEEVAKRLLPLETDSSSVYVLLSNIYADLGMWDMVKKIRMEFDEKGVHKSAGFASIEVEKNFYIFRSEDKGTYDNTQIKGVWTSIHEQMRELGYVPDIGFVHHDIDNELKAEVLGGHGKKLAII
ncbi:unnamed protein product [Ilex paraguariensis]|uniref:Uncharacterized protein n=1 Tax=Ilex paraguariensis TaxID=185542 RepID=A0ABC8S190_9AQUA